MRINRITLHNWQGYEEADLDLSGLTAVAVCGDNGSGKSALLDAVTWAVADRVNRPDIDSQDALIRDGTDEVRVGVEFTTRDGREVAVLREKQRGRTGTITLTVDGKQATAAGIRETLAAIAGLIGMPYEGLMAGPIMAQEASGAFMRMRPAQRKDLLSTLLGLDRYAALAVAASAKANASRAEAKANAALADAQRPRLDAEPEHHRAKAAATTAMHAAMEAQSLASTRKDTAAAAVAETRAKLAALDKAAQDAAFHASSLARLDQSLSRERARLAAAEAALAEPEGGVAEPDPGPSDEALRAAEAAVEAAGGAATTAAMRDAEAKALQDRLTAMTEARDRVAGVPCGGVGEYAACQFLTSVPTMEAVTALVREHEQVVQAKWDAEREAKAYPEAKAAREALRAQRSKALEERARAVTLRESRASARAHAMRERAESAEAIDGLQASIVETSAAAERAQAATGDTTTLRAALQSLLADAEMAASAYTAAQEARQDAERRIAQADAAIAAMAALRGEVADLDAKAKAASEDAATHTLLAQAFGRDGIPAQILAEAIPSIEAEANRILGMLPGGLTLALRTERTLGDGRTADTLDVVVTDAGWERQYGLLSVGQRFRADLALRVGIDRAVNGEREGTGMLWLDEPLAALDAEGRAAVTEALSALGGEFSLRVVVSHHPDFNDTAPNRIDVERQDGISTAAVS